MATYPSNSVQFHSGSNVFQTSGSPVFRQQAERFKTPEGRAAVRAEQREQILESHQDIGELLELDAATVSKLVELLADLQTKDLEQFYVSPPPEPARTSAWEAIHARAERETAKVKKLRDLLGQEKLERYQAFTTQVNNYRQVATFDAQLDSPHKLNLEQKQQLAELYREQIRSEIDRSRLSVRGRSPMFGPMQGQLRSHEELQRQSQLMTITANEESWRRMPKSDEQLRQRASAFLTPAQLDVLARMQADKASRLQQWIENARIQAGLSQEIPAEAEEKQSEAPPLLDGSIKLAVKLTINGGEATHFTHTGRNGEAVTFRAQGLIVEMQPKLFVDDAFDVRVSYFEPNSSGGRRLIGESGQMGVINRTSPGMPPGTGGSGGTVITGNKGYAVELSTQLEPV
ncbi:MAG: hypothetical protein ABW171_13350 [Steroidobacter sp.]